MRARIERELLTLGAPTGRLGYEQMACALELILQRAQVTSTTNVLYPLVAEKCATKAARIERNVREEIKAIWTYGNQSRLDQLFIEIGPIKKNKIQGSTNIIIFPFNEIKKVN